MTEELTRVLEELRGIVNNFTIRGSGVTGNIKTGYVVIPGSSLIASGSGGVVPPPTTTGACCPIDGDCFITSQAICETGGGTYQGDDTPCVPDPCAAFECGSFLNFACLGIMCDTSGATSYTSVFNLSPGLFAPAAHLSGSTGPSDSATLDWTVDMTLDGLGGYSITYGGTVTGKFGGTQEFSYSFSGICGVLNTDTHHDRFCGLGFGHCSDIFGCTDADTLLAFDIGGGASVSLTVS